MGLICTTLLKLLGWIYFLFPLFIQNTLVRISGFVFSLTGYRRSVIHENLLFAYPGSTEGEKMKRRNLARAFYDHLARVVLEVSMVFGPMARFVRLRSDIEGLEHWKEASKLGRGVLVLSSHVGNWEVMGAMGSQVCGIDMVLVTKRVKPGWFHAALEKSRLSYGVKATYEPRTLRDVLAQLKRGGTVGIVLDQYAGPPIGVRVPFFNVAVGTSTALATLAKRTGAPVVPVTVFRKPNGRWSGVFEKPIEWQSDPDLTRELALNTAQYAKKMEEQVLAHPDQWIWSHRRFKADLSPIRPDEWAAGRARV